MRIAYPNTIRIIFTGYADSKAVVDSVNRCEVYRYITKPWDPDELIDILHVAAKKHDIVAERHQIHLDLQRHLARNQTWTQRVRDGQSLSAASLSIELNECLAETAQLAQRLDRIIDEENTASGDHPSPLNE